MNIERYSDLTKAILQVAQTEALGAGHARLEALHVLQAMLSDAGGLARLLVTNAGGDVELLASSVRDEVEKLARVSGDTGQLALAPPVQKLLVSAEPTVCRKLPARPLHCRAKEPEVLHHFHPSRQKRPDPLRSLRPQPARFAAADGT